MTQRNSLADAINILIEAGWSFDMLPSHNLKIRTKSGRRGVLALLKCQPGEETEYFKGHSIRPVLSPGQTAYMASITGTGKRPLRSVTDMIGINGVQTSGGDIAQWLMDIEASHPRIFPHSQVRVTVGDQSAEVDELVAPFIERIWKAGINTWTSCQHADAGAFPMYINSGDGRGKEMARALGLKRGEYRIRNGVLWLPLPSTKN